MSKGIGFCGAHRTGKTTLAQQLSSQLGLKFVATSTSAVFARHGLNPAAGLDSRTRLWIQGKILENAQQSWALAPAEGFVTDRTPIDFIAYTLADVQGHTEIRFTALERYLEQCFEALDKYFQQLFVVQPGIPLIEEEGKAALNPAYIEHLNSLALGLVYDPRQRCPRAVLPRRILELNSRVDWVRRQLKHHGAD